MHRVFVPSNLSKALMTLRGEKLTSGVRIPSTTYRPMATTVSFWIDAPGIGVYITLPKWNIHSLWPSPHRNYVGRIGSFLLDASYRYHAEVHPEHIDSLKLSFVVSSSAFIHTAVILIPNIDSRCRLQGLWLDYSAFHDTP